MSYALNVEREASRALQQLPFDAQENCWDVFELIAADPRLPGELAGRTTDVHKFRYVIDRATIRVVFLAVIDDATQTVTVPMLSRSED